MGMLDLIMASEFGIQSGARPLDAVLSKIIFGGDAPVPPPPPPPPPPIPVVVPILPDDTTEYPLYINDAAGLRFAVYEETQEEYGYYWPSLGVFIKEADMTGDVIRRVEHVTGDGSTYCTTDYHLTGDDTLKIKYRVTDASNIGGCFVGSSADNNFCLYASPSASAGWYMRYDGGNDRSFKGGDNWIEMQATPTGYTANGSTGSWTQKEFTSTAPMYIGYLYQSTSPKIRGSLAYFEVPGKHKYLPVIVGEEYKLFDVLAWEFPEQVGTWGGGEIIEEEIVFPENV